MNKQLCCNFVTITTGCHCNGIFASMNYDFIAMGNIAFKVIFQYGKLTICFIIVSAGVSKLNQKVPL